MFPAKFQAYSFKISGEKQHFCLAQFPETVKMLIKISWKKTAQKQLRLMVILLGRHIGLSSAVQKKKNNNDNFI